MFCHNPEIIIRRISVEDDEIRSSQLVPRSCSLGRYLFNYLFLKNCLSVILLFSNVNSLNENLPLRTRDPGLKSNLLLVYIIVTTRNVRLIIHSLLHYIKINP